MSLFGSTSSPSKDNNVQETSFSMNFAGSTSFADSPTASSSFTAGQSSSFLSLFGNSNEAPDSPKVSGGDSFSLSFGGNSNSFGGSSKPGQFSGFSSSFGGSGDSGMGGSSLLSLFGSPQASDAGDKGGDSFTLQFGGGDNTASEKPFKLF